MEEIEKEPIIASMYLISDRMSIEKYITQEYKEYIEKYAFETSING